MQKLVIACTFILVFIQGASAQQTINPVDILSDLNLANNYFMNKWPDPGADIVTDKTRPSNLWTRATYYEGLMQLYFVTKDTTLYQYAYDWAESHDWYPTYGSLTTRDGDHQCCGQTYLELYQLKPEARKLNPIKVNIDNMIKTTKIDDWSWIDAIQMSMPVFAKLGVILNDTKYFDRMYEMFHYTQTQHGTNGLYNTEEGLWYRDKDFDPPYTTPNGLSCYWSRGNGWVYAALTRVLDVIPETETHYNEYLTIFREMSEALIYCQREDGFWNPSMFDPNDYGGKETSGTGFFVYGLAWGIRNGILDQAAYLNAVINGWNGLANDALHENGFLGWVQGTGKQPSDGQPLSYTKEPNFEDFGLGAFLLGGCETYQLMTKILSSKEEISNGSIQLVQTVYVDKTSNNLMLQLDTNNTIKSFSYQLFAATGQQLMHADKIRLNEQKLYPIQLEPIEGGIYILNCQINGQSQIIKFIF